MNYVIEIFYGFLIGLGAVLPGFSGSVLAVILNVYDRVINILNNKKISVLKKIKQLLPLSIGILLGILIFGKVLYLFFRKYEVLLKYIFIGFILGSIPILDNDIKNKKNKGINKKIFILSLILSLFIFILPIIFNVKISENISFLKLFLSGIFYMSGKIIPGISSSFFMMLFGLYEYVLLFFSNPVKFIIKNFFTLIPFFIGIVFGFILFLKLINFLLNKYFVETYSAIIGFIMGSILFIFPGFKLNILYIISLIFMIFSYLFIIFINNVKNKS